MPDWEGERGGLPLEDDEKPFFCLLEDDRLITALSVTTDRLLMPVETDEHVKHVYLVIHVTAQNPSALVAGGRLV
jgi:hypothetical protein